MKIHTLDLNFQNTPHTIASYLILGGDGPILVETGPGSTLKTLLAELARHGLTPADIRHILLTHIHLDHAGCAGWWAQQGAQLYVHPIGAPHLIDPGKLIASASRIYGAKMDSLWGEILPAPAERVTAVYDNDTLHIAGLTFTALETPGHASHHHTYRLGRIGFTGDAAGIRLPGSDFVDLPAPPPEFNRELWLQTLDRIEAENFEAIYPTHFGRIDDIPTHLDQVRQLILSAADFVHQQMQAGLDADAIIPLYEAWVRRRAQAEGVSAPAVHQYETANPWYMSVTGILRYWRKKL